MKYLKKFQTNADYQTFKGSSDWVTPNVSLVTGDNHKIIFSPSSATPKFILEWNGTEDMGGVGYTHMEFEFEPGMTVNNWMSSSYNTYGMTLCNESGRSNHWRYSYGGKGDVIRVENLRQPTSIIEEKTYYFSSSYCCFIAGTQVTMSDNSTKNIEDIVVGDKVLSLNMITNELYETIVKQVITNPRTINIAKVTLENGTSVTMNSYHPLLTVDGWKSLTNYNNYPSLIIGDDVITDNLLSSKIINIERWDVETPITTYTINVIDNNEINDNEVNDNFFANGICAHNALCPA